MIGSTPPGPRSWGLSPWVRPRAGRVAVDRATAIDATRLWAPRTGAYTSVADVLDKWAPTSETASGALSKALLIASTQLRRGGLAGGRRDVSLGRRPPLEWCPDRTFAVARG